MRIMKQKLVLLLGILTMMNVSCQHEDDGISFLGQDDAQRISFTFSVDSEIDNGVDYTPMRATTREGEGQTKIALTNGYNYIIVKDVEGKLVVEIVGKGKIDQNLNKYNWTKIVSGSSYGGLNVELQPGDYEILLFTGDTNVDWNEGIKKGDVLYDPDNTGANPVNAFIMSRSTFWAYANEYVVAEEIFFGRQAFTVTKTTDLHSSPNAHNVPINLERRVTKFRTALKDEATSGGLTFAKIAPLAVLIKVSVIKTDHSNFAYGLDVWGNLWYDPLNELKQLQIITMTEDFSLVAGDTRKYYISRYGCTAFTPYMLSSPGVEIPITTTYVDGSIQQGAPRCVYGGELSFILRHNSIKGFTLKLTDDVENVGESQPAKVMEPVYNPDMSLLDPTELFESNYEYNYE